MGTPVAHYVVYVAAALICGVLVYYLWDALVIIGAISVATALILAVYAMLTEFFPIDPDE